MESIWGGLNNCSDSNAVKQLVGYHVITLDVLLDKIMKESTLPIIYLKVNTMMPLSVPWPLSGGRLLQMCSANNYSSSY